MLVVMLLGHYILKRYRRSGYNFTRVVIVGTGPTAMRLVQAMKQDPGFGYCILGCFDDNLVCAESAAHSRTRPHCRRQS